MNESPSPRQYDWAAIGLAAIALIVTALPYILGYLWPHTGKEFGGVVMNFEDSYSYLAKMRQGQEGSLLYQIPFTSEEHDGALIGTFYFFWGWSARLTGWPLIFWWHLSRIFCSALLLLVAYLFASQFLKDWSQRLFAFSLAIFGSGLGWFVLLVQGPLTPEKIIPDFRMPEAHPFFTLLTFPHFSFATALLLATFLLVLLYLEKGSRRYSLGAGVTALLMTVALPYLALALAWILALYLGILLIRKEGPDASRILGLWPVAVFPLPSLLYFASVLATNPVFGEWWEQATTPSPPLWDYALAFGIILLLALPAFKSAWREKGSLFLAIWTLGIILLLYLPLNPQRRMIQGAHIPLSILATMGTYNYFLTWLEKSGIFAKIVTWRPERYKAKSLKKFALILLFLLTLPSNLYIVGSLGLTMIRGDFPFFRDKEEVEVVDWLAANAPEDAIVLSSYETGSYIPSRAGARVFIGHWAETTGFQRKLAAVDRFFAETTPDEWRIEFLRGNGIDYLFYGPREGVLGRFHPEGAPYLEQVFANNLVTVYSVNIPR